jgi:hypothetical protein
MAFRFRSGLMIYASVFVWASLCLGQSAPPGSADGGEQHNAQKQDPENTLAQPAGVVRGTVVDQSGAVVTGARIELTREGPSLDPGSVPRQSAIREVLSGGDGQFSFANVGPGRFQLRIASAGFATQTISGVLHAGEVDTVPAVALAVATNNAEVEVSLTRTEVAEQQIKIEEKQRVLGVLPNFYVSYIPDAAPLNPQQKFRLALKTVVDPVTFVFVGGVAGVQQAQNHFAAYGQGAEGYAKRFGAGYADAVTGTFIGGAILPSLLKQDPRYFYKGTGSKESRALYAIAMSVVCKGDNGHWQPNYSNIIGGLAAGGISNLYYPAQDRDGAELTFENAAIGTAATAVSNLIQEFLLRKLTPKLPKAGASGL